MVTRNAPQALPRAPESYDRIDEQQTRDMIDRAIRDVRRANTDQTYLIPSNDLSDVANAATALANLGGRALTNNDFTNLTINNENFVVTANYGEGTDDTLAIFVMGSAATPSTSGDAAYIIQKFSDYEYPGPNKQNATLYVSHKKYASGNLSAVQGIFSEVEDHGGGTGSFFEGGRDHAIGFAANFSAYGRVAVAGGDVGVAADYLFPFEGWVQNNNNMTPPITEGFDKNNFSAAFIASFYGTHMTDAGFATNPFSPVKAQAV